MHFSTKSALYSVTSTETYSSPCTALTELNQTAASVSHWYVWCAHRYAHSGPMQNDICWREGTRWSKMTGLWPHSELSDMLWKWWWMACWRGSKCSKILPKEHHLLTAYVIHSLSWHPMEHMYAYIKERGGAKQINICLCAHLSWLTPWESRVNI